MVNVEAPDWHKLCRVDPVNLCGFEIPSLSRNSIIAMYPELEQSRWWVDQSADLYLSVFFGEVTPLGARSNNRWFGVASWRPKLRARFKIDCVYEALSRFADPMTGQQKNFLAALVSMAQMETTLVDPESGKGEWIVEPLATEFEVQDEDFKKNVEKMHLQEATARVMLERLSAVGVRRKLSHFQALHNYPSWIQGISVSHESPTCVKQYCRCDYLIRYPDQEQTRIVRRGRSGTPQILETQMLVEAVEDMNKYYARWIKRGVAQGQPVMRKHRRRHRIEQSQERFYVDIIGSRMGLDSGLWHSQFLDFVATYYSGWGVRFFDPFESASQGCHKGVYFEHRRELYVGPRNTMVQVDDAQTGEDHVPTTWLRSPYYSSKKQGKYCFGIRETREFSHIVPAKFSRSLSSCACLRCKITSYLADVYGGWPVYERLREMLAHFGPVCEHSSMVSTVQRIIEAQRQYEDKGTPVPEAYRPFVQIKDQNSEIQEFIRNRSGAVYAYISEFQGMTFSRTLPLEFVVDESTRSLQEIGMVPYFITQAETEMAGYLDMCRIGKYRVLKIQAVEPECSFELKF